MSATGNIAKLGDVGLSVEVAKLDASTKYDLAHNDADHCYVLHELQAIQVICCKESAISSIMWASGCSAKRKVLQACSQIMLAAKVPAFTGRSMSHDLCVTKVLTATLGVRSAYQRDTRAEGTSMYLDPEYYRSLKYTKQSDIYSMGLVMLQLVTGRCVLEGFDKNFEKKVNEKGAMAVADPRADWPPEVRPSSCRPLLRNTQCPH